MEIVRFIGNLKKQRGRRGYNRLSPNRKKARVVRFGTVNSKRSWRLRLTPKLRLVRLVASPLKLWHKFKNAYVNMMLRLANSSGTCDSGQAFGNKRIPKARDVPMNYSRTEFENRLIFEIYKSMLASFELGYVKQPDT